jgi:hypothetical protein
VRSRENPQLPSKSKFGQVSTTRDNSATVRAKGLSLLSNDAWQSAFRIVGCLPEGHFLGSMADDGACGSSASKRVVDSFRC